MEEQQQEQRTAALNKAWHDFNALKIRLDTQPLLDQIELYLRGAKQVVMTNDAGDMQTKTIVFGVPKANENGIQSMLNWISATINPQTVQGNFVVDNHGLCESYDRYIKEYHIELATMIVVNAYNWEIHEDEMDGIISMILLLIQPFMSRLIENKERESYGETMRTIESNVMRSKGGGINLFNQ